MDSDKRNTLIEDFSILENPRDPSKCLHKLIDIVVIAVTAVLCGADNLTCIESFGKAKIEWFRRFLSQDNGVPSHDTFCSCRMCFMSASSAGSSRYAPYARAKRSSLKGSGLKS